MLLTPPHPRGQATGVVQVFHDDADHQRWLTEGQYGDRDPPVGSQMLDPVISLAGRLLLAKRTIALAGH